MAATRTRPAEQTMTLAAFTDRPVATVHVADTVALAARKMCRQGVGALVLVDEREDVPVGIVTDRDLMWMVAEGLDPAIATVGELMQPELQVVPVTADVAEAAQRMRRHGVRRLPIVDPEGRLVGIVTLDDLLETMGSELADLAGAVNAELGRERHLVVQPR